MAAMVHRRNGEPNAAFGSASCALRSDPDFRQLRSHLPEPPCCRTAAYIGMRFRVLQEGMRQEELTAPSPVKGNLAEAIQRRFAAFGGLEFALPRCDAIRQSPEFAE